MNLSERDEQLRTSARNLSAQLTDWRRYLHRNPELSFKETETTAFLQRTLQDWGLDPVRKTPTGLWVDIEGAGARRAGGSAQPHASNADSPAAGKSVSRTVAIRADIDALPIQELNDFDFRSARDGVMHACGHDGHTAILLGVARTLLDLRDAIPGRVRLLFQPAEEQLPGGARQMIGAGALEGVDEVIGLHLWSQLQAGKAGIRPGAMMANADDFTIDITGRGGHGASPHETVDALTCAAQMVVALQQVVSRNVDPLRPGVLTVGTLHTGTNFNIIAQEARLTGTVRTFDEETRDVMQAAAARTVEHVASAFGATAELAYRRGYPALENDASVCRVFEGAVRDLMGNDAFVVQEPFMGGEDFAYYLKERPGAFLFLGAGNEAVGANHPHHHPNFTVDESALPDGVAVLASTAWRLLEGAGR